MRLKPCSHLVIGLMSGTSADGIDAVLVRISTKQQRIEARIIERLHRAFTPALQRRILTAGLHGSVSEICELNFVLGEQFARAALSLLRKARLRPKQIAAIGSHGQTVHHLPNAQTPSTLQIGEPSIIAERTGITTIADFRVRDMAAGGQGAPLVPFADWVLFTDRKRPRIVQNIGGIANLTFLPPEASLPDVMAFDTGPGNMVIDGLVSQLSQGTKTFDRNGAWAAGGSPSEKLLAQMTSHPFLKRSPPKTTGREEFGQGFLQPILAAAKRWQVSDADLIATATQFTAATIADAYERFVFPKLSSKAKLRLQIILGGGGPRNPTLRRMLTELLAPAQLLTHEDFGIPNEAKEALAFAILAHQTLLGLPSNVPSATGAKRAVVLGKIVPGV